jgi:hypothetical protein
MAGLGERGEKSRMAPCGNLELLGQKTAQAPDAA